MLRSMTGFGRSLLEEGRISQQWEIRSVNGRYLDIKWRLPPSVRHLETTLEKVVRRHAERGRLEIALVLRFSREAGPKPAFDKEGANAMLVELAELAKERGEEFKPDYTSLLSMSSLWADPELEDGGDLDAVIEDGLVTALEDWNESRQTEARRLKLDLDARIEQMREWAETIALAAPGVKAERIQNLRERIAAVLAGGEFELSEDRFLQEIAILTDRLDVSEELTRLSAHLERMTKLLRDGSDAGRKLDFTLQECFREINTCGNKIQDADLSALVVDFKNELEKCREQAQNLE